VSVCETAFILRDMSSKTQTGVRLTPALVAKLEYLKQRDGIPYSEQVRRALAMWFEHKGVTDEFAPRTKPKKVARG